MKPTVLFSAGVGLALLFAAGCAQKPAEQPNAPAATAIAPAGHPQTTCPVMGSKVNAKSLYVDANGKRIYVCCPDCVAAVKEDPAKYIAKLEAEGVVLATVPQADGE